MEMSRDAEKLLEKLWIYWVYLEGNDDEFIQRDLLGETALKELEDLNLLEYGVDEKVHLTPEGFEESGRINRRLKLSEKSEKLFNNVLGVNQELKSFEGSDFE